MQQLLYKPVARPGKAGWTRLFRCAASNRVGPRNVMGASVMIEKFAGVSRLILSEFLHLNHASKSMILVSLMIPKFAREANGEVRRTSESRH